MAAQRRQAKPKAETPKKVAANGYTEDLDNGIRLEMLEVPSGTFMMGSPASNARSNKNKNDEEPQHRVAVSRFFVGKYEITIAQWRKVAQMPKVNIDLKPELTPDYIESDPDILNQIRADWLRNFGGDNNPAVGISWEEAMEFCARLSEARGRQYRLPSEAEWEYACRAGTQTEYSFGDALSPRLAVYNGAQSTMPGGSKKVANAFGLFDMHGNVDEWCLDVYHNNYVGAPRDGKAWLEGGDQTRRVVRGGSWQSYPILLRSAARYAWYANEHYLTEGTGFRVVADAANQ